MSTIDDSGPAFPVVCEDQRDTPSVVENGFSGMSLRDYFAGKALEGVPLALSQLHDVTEAYDRIATHAYKLAEAMIRARKIVP